MSDEIERLNEKNVISAMSQNEYLVELGERLYDIFEGEEWVDEETRERMSEIRDFSDSVWGQYHDPEEGRFKVESIKSMRPEDHPELEDDLDEPTTEAVQTELAQTLDEHTGEALDYTRELLDHLEGNEGVLQDLDTVRSIIDETVEESVKKYSVTDATVDVNYELIAEKVGQEIDYAAVVEELDPERMATYIASELDVDYEKIASNMDIDEEEVAMYIDEKEIAQALNGSQIAEGIDISAIDQEFYGAMLEFAGEVAEGAESAEDAYNELLDKYEDAVESYEELGGDVVDFVQTFGEKKKRIDNSVESLERTVEQSQSRVQELDSRMQEVKDRLGR